MLKGINLAKIYHIGGKTITPIQNATFTLAPDDFVFLVGKSGAGKTTLLKILFLEEYPTRGQLYFNDIEITHLKGNLLQLYRQHVGVVFQDYKLLEHKTARENIEFVLEILKTPKKQREQITEYLLELVELKDRGDMFPSQLSGGEKRRVAIARAVANRPKILLADEPTGDLDDENSELIMEILKRIHENGTAIIMATHRLDIIQRYPKYKIWKLVDGILSTQVSRRSLSNLYITTAHKIQDKKLLWLSKHLPATVFQKIMQINPKNISEILVLTPKELKEELDFSYKEIETLKEALTKLTIIE